MNKPCDQDSVNKITQSPSYRLAYKDLDFLNSPRLRAARMELEVLKAEMTLEDYRIQNTIVVFGSTRLVEPAEAAGRLKEAQQRLAGQPDDPRCRRAVAQAQRLMAKSGYYEVAREFSRLASKNGSPRRQAALHDHDGRGAGDHGGRQPGRARRRHVRWG